MSGSEGRSEELCCPGSGRKVAKCQALKAAWQSNIVQALVEFKAECQTLGAAWQSSVVQALVEKLAKCPALKAARASCASMFRLKSQPNVRL